jgi:pimeloyl-ACP methyl ester carboxylesterase
MKFLTVPCGTIFRQVPSRKWSIIALRLLGIAFAVFAAGCASQPTGWPKHLPDRAARKHHGYLYYFDGAGGGTAQKNWAEGVRDGLLTGGYPGAGEMFTWETGEGLIADQDASVKFKRDKALKAVKRIEREMRTNPGVPVDLLGFSAGTAVAIFALEDLPETVQINEVVLLGTSISENYDLTQALKRVRGHVYLYTSTHDRMLRFLMPFSGTADRKFDDPGTGITGFVLPAGATAETRRLYAEKVITIPWTAKLEKDSDFGHHFDNVKMEFIRDHVAPLFTGKSVPGLVKQEKTTGKLPSR